MGTDVRFDTRALTPGVRGRRLGRRAPGRVRPTRASRSPGLVRADGLGDEDGARLTAASLAGGVGYFAVGLGPVSWLLFSEILPSVARGRRMSIAAIADRAFNLLVALTFLDLVNGLGQPATFFLYAAPTALGFLFTLRLVPKIERRGPEDMGEAWAERGVEAPSIR